MTSASLAKTDNRVGSSTNYRETSFPLSFLVSKFLSERLGDSTIVSSASIDSASIASASIAEGKMLHKISMISSNDIGQKTYTEESIFQLFAFFKLNEQSLNEALAELAELDDYAKDEELTSPSPVAKDFAKQILEKFARELPRYYSVSLWEDGDVVIAAGESSWRISIYCRANGGASLYVNSPHENDSEHHYQLAKDLPVDLITDALKKIPT